MHRDFQSQNLFIRHGKIRVLDFQTAHRGLLQYDLASLLGDAYMELSLRERDILLEYYRTKLTGEYGINRDFNGFRNTYILTCLQRNMQALGAFSFLSMKKGKKAFRKYIPAGLRLLKQGLSEINKFPVLKSLIQNIDLKKINNRII